MAERKRKKKKARSPHPGVTFIQRSSGTWIAKIDEGHEPARDAAGRVLRNDNGEPILRRVRREVNVSKLGLDTAEARKDWGITESRKLAERKVQQQRRDLLELVDGTRFEPEPEPSAALADAVEVYFADAGRRLRERTMIDYRAAVDELLAWCAGEAIDNADQLTGEGLYRFREACRVQVRQVQARGKRGSRVPDPEGLPRSPLSINRILRSCATVLEDLRGRGLLPLSKDEIRDNLRPVKKARTLPRFLRADECAALMDAALRHDAETWSLTREEKAAGKAGGDTAKYAAIAPVVLVALLTGMRAGELMGLEWGMVRLDMGANGEPDGILDLPPSLTKTAIGREVELRISPTVQHLLAAMKLCAAPGEPFVFGGAATLPRHTLENARRRLVADYGAPPFGWHDLRRTCGTFSTNAEGVFGASVAPYASATRLGHSVAVAMKSYVGRLRNVPRNATTLEAAMGIEAQAAEVVARMAGGAGAAGSAAG